MMKVFKKLEQIQNNHLLTEKIMIMPSYSAGQQFLESAAKNNIKTLNTKVETISDIAHELIDDYLYKNNLNFIDRTSSYLLIKNIVTKLYNEDKKLDTRIIKGAMDKTFVTSREKVSYQGNKFQFEITNSQYTPIRIFALGLNYSQIKSVGDRV